MIIGEYCNIATLLSAARSLERLTGNRTRVWTGEDRSEVYDTAEVDSAIRNFVQASFPANGAMLLETVYDDAMKPDGVSQRAILGFYLDATGELRAVTMDGNAGNPTILFADGRVERFEDHWDSLEAYTQQLIKEGKSPRLVGAEG